MIRINLLPHREARRRQRQRQFFSGIGLAAAAGSVIVGLWYGGVQQLNQIQLARNSLLRTEIGRMELQIKDIAHLRAEIDGLKSRQAAVEDLQLNRNLPVHLLDQLVRLCPEGLYLSSLKQTDSLVLLTGLAQTNERVSEFLRNTQNNSAWLDSMELVEIKAVMSPPAAGLREQRRLYEFALRVAVKPPGVAASGPARGRKAA